MASVAEIARLLKADSSTLADVFTEYFDRSHASDDDDDSEDIRDAGITTLQHGYKPQCLALATWIASYKLMVCPH